MVPHFAGLHVKNANQQSEVSDWSFINATSKGTSMQITSPQLKCLFALFLNHRKLSINLVVCM